MSCIRCGKELTGKQTKFCSLNCGKRFYDVAIPYNKRPAYYPVICAYCGEWSYSKDAGHSFCSKLCSIKARHGLFCRIYYCQACGKVMDRKMKYCSEDCRSGHKKICVVCGVQFIGMENERFHSDECKNEYNRLKWIEYDKAKYKQRKFVCAECGKHITTEYGDKRKKYCSDECADNAVRKSEAFRNGKKRQRHARRARKNGGMVEKFNDIEIFERDNWICGICGERVYKTQKYPHPKSPTLDHIIPFSRGGHHTKNNVQIAHFDCNSIKSDNVFMPQSDGQLKMCL